MADQICACVIYMNGPLVTSPTTNESAPCFNENYNISDVLARSPSGSVADLTQIQSDSEMEKSVEVSIQEPVRQQESIETKQKSCPVETAKEEFVENPEELEAEKLGANVAVTVTSPQGTE